MKDMPNKKVVFGVLLLLIFFVTVFLWSSEPHSVVETVTVSDEHENTADPFTLAQYYFNHDDDPSGPYNLEKARAYYLEALGRNEDTDPMIWYQLGRINFLQGSYGSALWRFNQQVELFGDVIPNVHYMLGLTYGYKARETNFPEDWTRAEESFQRFLEYEPDSPWAMVDLAWIYFSQGKYTDMYNLLEEKFDIHNDNAWYLNAYGLSLLHTGNSKAAHEYFVLAKAKANELTPHEWGLSYPGNDPGSWEKGLAEMQSAIAHNVVITEGL